MPRNRAPAGDGDTIETLRTLITTASRLATELADDPLRNRWLQLFARVPIADRDPLLELLEREIGVRLLTSDGDTVTGFRMSSVMASARIFARVYDTAVSEREPNRDVIVKAVMRAAQVIERPDGTRDPIIAGVLRESLVMFHPDQRKAVLRFLTWISEEISRLDTTDAAPH